MRVQPILSTFLCGVMAAAAGAQPAITVSIDPHARSAAIPPDFLGLSFESSNLLPEPGGRHLFSPRNQPFLALFRTLGIHSLRIGGATADMPKYAVPDEKDIDELFAFAAAADLRVIYTLRLPRADVERDAAIARYIQRKYGSRLACFEVGNEPDFYRRVYLEYPDYAAYRAAWKKITGAIRKAAPQAKFCGPAAGETTAWSRQLAADFSQSGLLAAIVQHEYTGGNGNLLSDAIARDEMLSRAWLERYDRLYNSFAVPALEAELPYRLEETNNFTGGAKNASDTFAAALWVLDYLHWWAAHGASGLNFHNRRWILNTTIYPVNEKDDGLDSGYLLHPIAYGMKAFELGAHGAVACVKIANPEAVNLTAYAVRDRRNLLVTLINKKDPGTAPREVNVTIAAPGIAGGGDVIFLEAPAGDVAAKTGITLGGAPIEHGAWDGKWTRLESVVSGQATVHVPAAAAAIVRLLIE